jgi:hypothetical protein
MSMYTFIHNLLNVLVQIGNKMGFKKNIILPAAIGSGVYSASNRNEYEKHKNNNVSGE